MTTTTFTVALTPEMAREISDVLYEGYYARRSRSAESKTMADYLEAVKAYQAWCDFNAALGGGPA